jgi:DNA repair protein RadD
VCDRTTLIDQTSATADRYGLSAHGVVQADHWRTDYSKPFQIASAQTLARRQWPMADVIIIDEAHTQLKAWTEYIGTTQAAVIGLSATPFSPGLGKLFSNLVNATTMSELTQSACWCRCACSRAPRPT